MEIDHRERRDEGVSDIEGQQHAAYQEQPPVEYHALQVGKAELEVPLGRGAGHLEVEEERREEPESAYQNHAEPPPYRVADYGPGEQPYPSAERRDGVV